jgi:hypothetical protein
MQSGAPATPVAVMNVRQLALMVFEDTLRTAGFATAYMLLQRAQTKTWIVADKVALVLAGGVGSLLYHTVLSPVAQRTVRPALLAWIAAAPKPPIQQPSPSSSPPLPPPRSAR